MTNYKTIMFDLDGTLTDSKLGITKSVKYALSKFDIAVNSLDELDVFIGPPLADSFIDYYSFTIPMAKQAVNFYREYFSIEGKYENNVYNGIENLLKKLKLSGKQLVVATSKPTFFSEDILKHFNLYDYFDIIAGSELDGSRASKAEVIEYSLSQLNNLNLDNVVMVGDRNFDILGAKSNNIDSIGVTYGYGSTDEIIQAEPNYIINSVKNLETLLLNKIPQL